VNSQVHSHDEKYIGKTSYPKPSLSRCSVKGGGAVGFGGLFVRCRQRDPLSGEVCLFLFCFRFTLF
jgi:hypothetical protein